VRIVSVVGTRPQLIKAAALEPALRARFETSLIDTGQHYDDAMAGAFFRELGLRPPDHDLEVGGGSGSDQTGRMLIALDPILRDAAPDAVLVYGDTNTTLAAALVAAKQGVPIAHVEAGLRSFDRRMPEEINRVIADHLSRWLFAPTPAAVENLRIEGIVDGVVRVGDVLQDLVARMVEEVRDPSLLADVDGRLRPGRYILATIHRAENRERPAMEAWAASLAGIASPERPVILALHPGTRAALEAVGLTLSPDIRVIEPQGYRTTLGLQLHAAAVVTDSGGVQREAAWLGVPCLVLRGTTEWVEAVAGSGGSMVVVGLDAERARRELERLAPTDATEPAAERRAAQVAVEPAGAVAAIVETLAGAA
jgi:UDP-N-acetylglucosamine 2-epimerase